MINDIKISDNFKLYEFQSRDTLEVMVDSNLIEKLQKLRNLINEDINVEEDIPLIVNSGYRTPEHNKSVGGANNSYHMEGMAADIRCPEYLTIDEFAKYGEIVGFDGIGKYYKQNFVHFDTRNYKARWDDN